ncbi:MAG: hypothetical protein J6X84_08715 [Treponema sp.]|nr:hypothetical protein [Treponema sp.]
MENNKSLAIVATTAFVGLSLAYIIANKDKINWNNVCEQTLATFFNTINE